MICVARARVMPNRRLTTARFLTRPDSIARSIAYAKASRCASGLATGARGASRPGCDGNGSGQGFFCRPILRGSRSATRMTLRDDVALSLRGIAFFRVFEQNRFTQRQLEGSIVRAECHAIQ
jgi:hypothetical protein